tara:strand:- start:394 stop:1920 length:1527 start_codon:yes stop_codon:yes gene_type:complete
MTRARDISNVITDANLGGTLDVSGIVTANAGVKVDNITIDGTEIDLSGSGDFSVDVGGDIILDADSRDIKLQDGGTDWGLFQRDTSTVTSSFVLKAMKNDSDMKFKGVDNNSEITALTLDMSDAGSATFNSSVTMSTSLTGQATDGQFEFISKDTSGSGSTDYGDFIFKGRRGADNDTVTIMNMDGATGKVGIGTTSPSGKLHVRDTSGNDQLVVGNTSESTQLRVRVLEDDQCILMARDGDTDRRLVFQTGITERARIETSGKFLIGTNSDTEGKLNVFTNDDTGYVAMFHNDGNNSNRKGILIKSGFDSAGGTNKSIDIADGNGTVQGQITFSSGTVTYGAFTAFHHCIIPNSDNDANSPDNAYPYGTLLEITSITYTQKNGVNTERGIRYNVQKSSSAKSKSLLGAYGSSMNDESNDNLHQALVLGDGHILCNNENGNIEIGDYICSSSKSGEGMKAKSICNTIGIAREAITFSNSTAVLVAVEYGYRQFVPEDLEARIKALEGA